MTATQEKDFVPEVGRLVRLKRKATWPRLNEIGIQNWDGVSQYLPEGSILFIVRVERGTSRRQPYWKVHFLFGEQYIYYSDHVEHWDPLFEYVDN